jgi:hypothetical protein
MSGYSMACLRIEPKMSSIPNMKPGNYDVPQRDGQRGLPGIAGTRQRQTTSRVPQPRATIRLIESGFSRAAAHRVAQREADTGIWRRLPT